MQTTKRTLSTGRTARWKHAGLAGMLALSVLYFGCSERPLAPPAAPDNDNATSLRESFDDFYQSKD